MFDELWSEIQDAPGEIFDIPELRELDEENNQYNDDEDVEFWTDILSRLQQQYHHALYTS